MKNVSTATEYVKATAVMAWLEEAREIIKEYPLLGEERLRIAHSFTRTGYKVSWIPVNEILNKTIANYPHTSFQKRPEVMELVHRITKSIDSFLEYQESKTVEVIRLSDGKHMMETPEMAKAVVEEFKVAKYA